MSAAYYERQHLTAECPECGWTQAAEMGELGPEIETWPCEGSGEKHYLCQHCRQECEACGRDTCEEHSTLVEGKPWCSVCLPITEAKGAAA